MTVDPMRSTSHTMEEGHLKSGLSRTTKCLPMMAKASVQELNVDIHTVDNFNKVIAEMIKQIFPTYIFLN